MSEDNNQKQTSKRYIGKFRVQNSQYGDFYKIYMDNISDKNADGTVNEFYKGSLIWSDINGNMYQVKQMSLVIPKNGLNPKLAEKGYTHFVVINLEDGHEVTLIS